MRSVRTSESTKKEIEARFGFLPPFFEPALETPEVLLNLWQQTLSAYVSNPLPALFKEKLFARLSRYCGIRYCIVCHSCALRPLGMTAGEVLDLLERPAPSDKTGIKEHVAALSAEPGPRRTWPEPNSALEASLIHCSEFVFLNPGDADLCVTAIRRFLSLANYARWAAFLSYVKTYFTWVEAHPELSYQADKRARENLEPLLKDAPGLAEFFSKYNKMVEPITQSERAEERFHLAVEAAPNAMVMVNQAGKIVFVNAQTERFFGYSRAELIGQPVEILVPERSRSEHPEYRASFIADPRARPMGTGRDLYGLRKDGHEFPVDIGLNPIETEEGTFVLSSIIDITERKRAEDALRESAARMRGILESALDCIVTMNHEGQIIEFNPAAEKTFGYSREQVIGKPMAELLIPPSLRERHFLGLKHYMATGEGPVLGKRVEMTAMRADGTEFPIELAVTPVGLDGPPIFTGYIRDTTERKLAEEALTLQARELAHSNAELKQFASFASHDLQEPLRKIQAFGDRLNVRCANSLGEEGRDYLNRIRDAAHRMQSLINDLLMFSQVTAMAQPFVSVNLCQVAAAVLSDLQLRIEQTGGRVEVGSLPTLDADQTQMYQLLQNLIGNALKFHRAEEAPIVKVYGRKQEGKSGGIWKSSSSEIYQVFVEDNGIGFDEKYLDRIFVPFQRLQGRGKYEGTGVGLAICLKIAERHGGSITAKSKPGQGSTFIVTLPVKQPQG